MKKSFWRTLLTEDADDRVWCPLRIFFVAAFALFLFLTVWSVIVLRQPFNIAEFATGAGLLLTGAGGAFYLNGRSDPPKEK